MTTTDEADFMSFARQQCDLRVIPNASPDPAVMLGQEFVPDGESHVSLTCREFLERVEILRVPENGLHVVEFLGSEVVQFRRSQMTPDKARLNSGRLWFEPRTRSGPKSTVFVKWAERLLSYVRRNYEPGPAHRYVGPDAASQRDAKRIVLGMPTAGMTREEALKKLGLLLPGGKGSAP